MNPTDEINTFINEMLDAKQLSGVDDEVRSQLVDDLREKLISQIDRAIIEALPDDKVDALNELLDANASEEAVQELVKNSGVDVHRVTIDTMLRFRSLYIGEEEAEA